MPYISKDGVCHNSKNCVHMKDSNVTNEVESCNGKIVCAACK